MVLLHVDCRKHSAQSNPGCQSTHNLSLYSSGTFSISIRFFLVLQTSNNVRTNDQFRAVRLPDVNPANLPVGADFSYTAGGFLEVYGAQRGEWDCVVTCFFLDTANNLIDYIECIQNILAPQAFWINFGPLLYHYQDLPHEQSVELSYEELRHVILSYNFSLLEESTHETTYTANPESLMNTLYRGQFFVAQKLT